MVLKTIDGIHVCLDGLSTPVLKQILREYEGNFDCISMKYKVEIEEVKKVLSQRAGLR